MITKLDLIALIVLLIFLYLLVLSVLRLRLYKSRLKNKIYSNCCPICSCPLDRLRSNKSDNLLNSLTLNIFGFKRFYCKSCKWIGLLAKYTKKVK